MAYPTNNQFVAKNVPLNPSLHDRLLNGLTTAEQAFQALDKLSGVGDCVFINLLTRAAQTTPAGTWIREVANTELYAGHFTNAGGPAADLNNFTLNVDIPSTGIWALAINAAKNANAGILKVYMDAVQIGLAGGYDLYNAGLLPLNIVTIADCSPAPATVLTAGRHTLTFKIDGKNGLSGGFELYMSGVDMVRTA